MAYYYVKSTAEIMQNIINNIHEALPEADTKEGTFIRNVFINPTSDELSAMYGDMFRLKMGQSIITALGDDLDLLAANYFVIRKEAMKAVGKLRFYIKNSNKSQAEITTYDIPPYIQIPIGTEAATTATYEKESIIFRTTQLIYYDFDTIKKLPIDSETGYRYLEAAAEAALAGENGNVAAGEIINITSAINGIIAVKNPFSFVGGQDMEDDISLTERVRLAVTGNNIGTKNGYLRFALDQNNVIDAKVVGAGDNIMFRDGGYLDEEGNYHYGEGGCVDIYVRGHQNLEATYTFNMGSAYCLSPTNPYADIKLISQPVTSIASITSTTTGETFINADIYEVEQYSYTENDTTSMETFYAVDILWDFSLTDAFPDTDYYQNPAGLTATQIAALKASLDLELDEARSYMTNISYGIDWSTASTRTTSDGQTAYLRKVYINNSVYKLIARDDSNLNGRIFIMKNDEIYVRAYVNPDYILKKDTSDYAGSTVGYDAIHWLNTDKLLLNDTLTINYNYDSLIHTLQMNVDNQRCLTADVLIKQAVEVPIEVIANATIYNTVTKSYIKRKVATDINNYIATTDTLGGSLDRSDIVKLIKDSDYVDSVDLDSLTISIKGQAPQNKITITDNQYFVLHSLVLNLTYSDT